MEGRYDVEADGCAVRYAFGGDRKRAWPGAASRPLSDGRGSGVTISNFSRNPSPGHEHGTDLDPLPRNGAGDSMGSPSVFGRKGSAHDSLPPSPDAVGLSH